MQLLALLAAATTASPTADERAVLMEVIESPSVVRNEIQIEGLLCDQNYRAEKCDKPIHIRLTRTRSRLSLQVTIEENEPLTAHVELSRLPELDMQSVRIHGYYTPHISILLRLKFGEPDYGCYQNHDGRGNLDIHLEEGEPADLSVTTYPNCEIQTVTLSEAPPAAE